MFTEEQRAKFRQRFAAYKNGKKPYDAGRPVQEDGHDWSYGGWKQKISKYLGIDVDHDNTYDYEGYFNKYPKEAWAMLKGDPRAHFTDEFKTVYHPTFSQKSKNNDGSVYSGVVHPKYNPQGLVGGIWSPDYKTFTMSSDGYRGPVNMDDRRWYLENNEDNGVILREANGNLPIYDGVIWGGVLPNITVTGQKLPKYGGGKSEEDAFYERMLQRQAQLNSPTVLYTRANGNPVAFDTEGNLVDLVTGQKGTMMIPEVNVTAMHPRNYRSSYNPDVIRDFTDWVPIVSDVGLGLDAYTAFKNKDYTQAGILGGALLLPNIIENSGKYIYKGLRKLGVPQYFSKEMLQNREALWKRFKNLDIFDSLRGIKYVDDVYHGSKNTFDINHARAYAPAGMDTGFHMGSSPTPAYSRANGLLGGALYSGKLKLKEAPFELDDLNRWGWREIIAETDNNPKFKKYLEDKGIDLDRLLNTALDLEKEYDNLDSFGQQAYLKEHGGFESDKYMAKLFKDKNVSFKYKNKFETFDGVPEYSYAIYNPDNVVWNRPFLFNERKLDLEKLYDIGMAGKYSWNDPDKITILLEDLYRVLKDFPLYRLPGFKNGKTLKYENRRVPSIKDLQIPTFK